MIKHFFIGVFFTSLLTTTQAQPTPTVDSLNSLTISQKDTLRALHRLFQARHRGASTMRAIGVAEVGVGALLVGLTTTLVSSTFNSKVDGGEWQVAALKLVYPV